MGFVCRLDRRGMPVAEPALRSNSNLKRIVGIGFEDHTVGAGKDRDERGAYTRYRALIEDSLTHESRRKSPVPGRRVRAQKRT